MGKFADIYKRGELNKNVELTICLEYYKLPQAVEIKDKSDIKWLSNNLHTEENQPLIDFYHIDEYEHEWDALCIFREDEHLYVIEYTVGAFSDSVDQYYIVKDLNVWDLLKNIVKYSEKAAMQSDSRVDPRIKMEVSPFGGTL